MDYWEFEVVEYGSSDKEPLTLLEKILFTIVFGPISVYAVYYFTRELLYAILKL